MAGRSGLQPTKGYKMWKGIKWGFGLMIGAMVAHTLFWPVLIAVLLMVS